MNEQELRAAVNRALHRVAPEADLEALDPGVDLREALDIDSIGVLQFAAGLEADLGVTVPERDTAALTTLAGAVAYLRRAVSTADEARIGATVE